ncbi:MAG TPA: glutamate--tRNA ligase [Candidatus Saccharimonadales bacterium]|nr:glutamate--tRNA ligase [Candidatus Saccharimonadales bacterium]
MEPARTRFAPSPTGALHCGVVRTALFAWLIAKQSGGQFLLRIEDTDQKREVEGGLENIKETLRWLGLNWDEGPDVGGPYEPYIQSERLDIYKQYAQELLDKGLAYADPYSVEELEALREQAKAEKRPFLYRNHRPENPPKWDGTQPLRIKLEPKAWSWDDAVMGKMTLGPEMIDDYIIIKADGFPTYNFCHIIDDHIMKITHVTRSQEFISSVPKFLATHELLGWESPINLILPQVMDETGRRKLSKRHGAKPVLAYRDMGYLPEALLNFMATIGWNDGTNQEVYSLTELIEKFSIGRIQKSGGIFDEQRLTWMNGHWIRSLDTATIYTRCQEFWPEKAASYPEDYKMQVLGLIQERLKYFAEIPALTSFFFEDLPVNMSLMDDNKQLKKFDHSELKTMLEQARASLQQSDFSIHDLTERLNALLEATGQKPGVLFSLVRIATTQAPSSPGLADTLHVLGPETSLRRINTCLQAL